MDDRELWRELGQQLRADAVRASAAAGSGHPTSSMSAADLAGAADAVAKNNAEQECRITRVRDVG